MTGPTRPLPSLSLNGILALAGLCATLCVLAVPAASVTPVGHVPSTSVEEVAAGMEAPVDEQRIQRDATANLEAVGREVGIVFSVVEAAAGTVIE